jgi:starvation-inducible DNA-binding protein
MDTNIGVAANDTAQIAKQLTHLLADEHILYVKTRNFHWNVTGPSFNSLHLMFEQQYTDGAMNIDLIAERIRSLGHHAVGSMKEFLAISQLKESDGKLKAMDMVDSLLKDHEAIARSLKPMAALAGDNKDVATEDMLIGMLEQHEKTAWMLRSHLE